MPAAPTSQRQRAGVDLARAESPRIAPVESPSARSEATGADLPPCEESLRPFRWPRSSQSASETKPRPLVFHPSSLSESPEGDLWGARSVTVAAAREPDYETDEDLAVPRAPARRAATSVPACTCARSGGARRDSTQRRLAGSSRACRSWTSRLRRRAASRAWPRSTDCSFAVTSGSVQRRTRLGFAPSGRIRRSAASSRAGETFLVIVPGARARRPARP